MSPKQYKKVKLYRTLKVLFYCCGLPLFVFAVFCTAIKFIGHDPFNGEATFTKSLDMLQVYERTLSGSSLWGVWCAFGIWAVIAVFQIIFAKTIKNRRARMFATVAITLVMMLGALLIIDTVYARKIDGFTNPINGNYTEGLRDNVPDGVTMEDYRTQLSYYRTISSNAAKKDMSKNLIDKIDLLKRVYNVDMEGYDKIGSAGNVSNDAITYATVISDTGKIGVDISFSGGKLALKEVNPRKVEHKALLGGSVGYAVDDNILTGDDGVGGAKNWNWGSNYRDKSAAETPTPNYWDPTSADYLNREGSRNGVACYEAEQVIRLRPNANGELVINGEVYSHYVAVARTDLDGNEYYTWYTKDLFPANYDFEKKKGVITDGIYGKAIYNNNGNIADGWIFSLPNVLEILEDYYLADVEVDKLIKSDGSLPAKDKLYAQIVAAAAERRHAYYTTGAASDWEKALYKQEIYNQNKFSFTHYRLDELLAEVGNMLGRNVLFDYLLAGGSAIGALIDPFIIPLKSGQRLTKYLKDRLSIDLAFEDANGATTVGNIFRKLANDDTLTDVFIKLSYPAADEEGHFVLIMKPNAGDRELTAAEKGTYTGVRYVKNGHKYEPSSQGTYKKTFPDEYVELTAEERGTYTGKRYKLEDGEYIEDSNGTWKDCIPFLDIDFSNEFKGYVDANKENPDFAFDLDHLSEFLNNTLSKFIDLSSLKGLLGTVIGAVGGMIDIIDTSNGIGLNLTIAGLNLNIQLLDKDYNFAIDIDNILLGLLDGLYYYESSAIQPVWNFYVNPETNPEAEGYQNASVKAAAKLFEDKDRAYFTGTNYGSLIGSTLIGKTLGANMAMSGGISYDSKYGLTDLASVQQVKTDLSYMPENFPIYGLREMLALFSGVVVFMVFLSYYAAEREYLYATGRLVPKEGKRKKGKDNAMNDEESAEKPKDLETKEDSLKEETKEEPKEEPKEEQQKEAPSESPAKKDKKAKKEKKSKKGKGDPALEEGAETPVQENSDKEVR